MSNNYNDLLKKIDEFTRKFYLNKILRGSIYCAAILLALYIAVFLSVYYLHPSVSVKTTLFFSYLIIAFALLSYLIFKPLLSLLKLNKHLSFDEASILIGNHFSDIKDKLLNTLQLHQLSENNIGNSELVLASIDQKILELKPIPFNNAIRIYDNRKYLKYLFFPLLIILFIGILAPTILKEGSYSFFKYNRFIAPKAPFNFNLLNKKLTVTQGEDVVLRLKLSGNELPQEVYVEDGKNTYKLDKESISRFNYTFRNIQNDKEIRFTAGGFYSDAFTILVKPRPSLLSINAKLIFPAYLNKKAEEFANADDMIIPEGTTVFWQLKTAHSDKIAFVLNEKLTLLSVKGNLSTYNSLIKNNSTYRIAPKNSFASNADSLSHQITVIKDQSPSIAVVEKPDSLSSKALYFSGKIADDYGFSRLNFRYNIKQGDKTISSFTKAINIKKNQRENAFFYAWNLKQTTAKPGQTIEYFFEVADNDGVNGPKTARTETKVFQNLTQQQIAENLNASSQSLKQKMQAAIRLANTVEKESKKLGETLLDKKELSFDDKKQIEQLLDKQKQLEDAVKAIKNLNEKNNSERQENQQLKDELLEKQKQIKDLFDNVLDNKTKELLQKLQNLMEQNNKEQTKDGLSKMQLDNKTLKNELDRILELYKQLEFEQTLQNDINRLNDLAKQQKDLSEQSKNKKADINALKDKQKELSKSFNELKTDLKKLEDKNQQLDRPNPFQNPEKDAQNIQNQQQESKNQLDKGNTQKASENQQKAGQQMQQMGDKMSEMQQQGAEMESKINIQELRMLLGNLLSTSFEQEKTMLALKRMDSTDPSYTNTIQKQRNIKDNLKTIADSLYALSKRVTQIESAVNEEMNKINFNLDKSLESLGDRKTAEANAFQQYTMTSINNLALMLNEALEQMQKMQKNAKGGGKGQKQSMQQLSKMQQELNNNMQKAREQMQKLGNQGAAPKGAMSQEFGKMAQQQQMIREALEKINREENKDGSGKLGNLNQAIKDMKQTESDLVNKRLQQETINRQKELLTKLLDAEKAQRNQDEDSKRESKAAKDFPPSYQKMLEQFKKQQQYGTDLLQKLPPSLNYYYKNKIAEYFKSLNSGQ